MLCFIFLAAVYACTCTCISTVYGNFEKIAVVVFPKNGSKITPNFNTFSDTY